MEYALTERPAIAIAPTNLAAIGLAPIENPPIAA